MTVEPRVLERLRKLLALSKSSNVHEAAAAAAKAQELMLRHQLEAAELELGAEPDAVLLDELERYGARRQPWREIIARALAKANLCAIHTRRGENADGRTIHVVYLAGSASAAALVRYMHAYLVRTVNRLCRNARCELPTKTAAWRMSFKLGAAGVLEQRLAHAATAVRATAGGSALARVDQAGERAKVFVANLMAEAGKGSRVAQSSDHAAYLAGAAAARSIDLSRDAVALTEGVAQLGKVE